MHKSIAAVALATLLVLPLTVSAQRRETPFFEVGVVYTLPGVDKVVVRKDVAYKTVNGKARTLDLYSPAGARAGDRRPVVIFVNGVGDAPTGDIPKLKTWGQYTSWSRLAAASDMVAVTYEADASDVVKDLDDVVAFVRARAVDLGVDENRVAIWSCSANVRVAMPMTMRANQPFLRCAIVYYGIGAAQELRRDLPIFVARAGHDQPFLNQGIDAFVRRALDAETPLTFVSYVDGQHAFDLRDDTPRSREIVRQTLDFLATHLATPAAADGISAIPTPTRLTALARAGGVPAIRTALDEARRGDPNAVVLREQSLNAIGYVLLGEKRTAEAVELFSQSIAAFPESANGHDSLSEALEAANDRDGALAHAMKAIELAKAYTGQNREQNEAVRKAAEARVARLKGA